MKQEWPLPARSTTILRLWKGVSAFFNRRPEDIRVMPIVIAELELRDIERQIFVADLVEGSDFVAPFVGLLSA
jgi:hypothetical protein